MAWDKDVPGTGIVANTLDNLIRTNNSALDDGLKYDHDFQSGGVQTGDHKRVTLNDNGADTGLAAGTASHVTIWNNGGVLKFRNGTGTVRKVSGDGDVIVVAAIMFFYGNSAPTGWTIYSTVEDCLLAVKKTAGGGTYSIGGDGDEKGSWTPTGHTHTDPATAAHTLLSSESGVPAHTHVLSGDGVLSNDEVGSGKLSTGNTVGGGADITVPANSAANAAGGHAHGSGGATGSSSEANTYRPLAAVGVLATKDAY